MTNGNLHKKINKLKRGKQVKTVFLKNKSYFRKLLNEDNTDGKEDQGTNTGSMMNQSTVKHEPPLKLSEQYCSVESPTRVQAKTKLQLKCSNLEVNNWLEIYII